MLQAIDGNVTVAIDDISDSPRFYVNARVKNKNFMQNAAEWGEGLAPMDIQCQKVEGDNYMISNSDTKIFLGVRNDMLYFASDYDVAKDGGKFSSLKDGTTLETLVDGKLSYFSLDIDKLMKSSLAESFPAFQDVSVKKVVGYLDRLNVSVGKDKATEIELTTKQKISDIIKESIKE